MCCPPPNKAARQFGLNQLCFLLLQGLQACWSHAAEQVILKLWAERLFQSFKADARWFQDVILLCPLVWGPNQWNSFTVNSTQGGNNLFAIRNLQSLLYVTHLQPNFPPSYHWLCFPSGDFDFFHVLGFVFFIYIYIFIYLPWIWWDSKKVQIKCWREAPQMPAEGTAGCPGDGEGNCLTIKLSSSARSPPPFPTPCTLLSCT